MSLPVPVDVRGAEGVAVVEQRGVDQSVALCVIHQIPQVAQVAMAAAHAVASAVLVQDEHLTRTEPTLGTKHTQERLACRTSLIFRWLQTGENTHTGDATSALLTSSPRLTSACQTDQLITAAARDLLEKNQHGSNTPPTGRARARARARAHQPVCEPLKHPDAN